MAYPKISNSYRDDKMSAAVASDLVRKMVAREMRGPCDTGPAMERLEQKYGLPFWTLDHFRRRKAKGCDVGLFARIRGAYFDHCERSVKRLCHEMKMERMRGDDFDADLLAEAEALLEKILARKKGG